MFLDLGEDYPRVAVVGLGKHPRDVKLTSEQEDYREGMCARPSIRDCDVVSISDTSSAQASPSPATPSGRERLVALGYMKHPVGQSWLGFLKTDNGC